MKKKTAADYLTTEWSGGKTTQLVIEPGDARYADRDFLWRISSATVESEESDFTPLPDYHRVIATLQGEITLSHNGGEAILLRPYELHRFEGSDRTHSSGRCRDFNLMLRRNRAEGSVTVIRVTEQERRICPEPWTESMLLYCAEGRCMVCAEGEGLELGKGESLTGNRSGELRLTALEDGAVLLLCQMRRLVS